MKKKLACSFLAALMMLTFTAPKVEAFGDIVHDPQSLVEQLLAFERQFESVLQGRLNLLRATFRLNKLDDTLTNLEKLGETSVGVQLAYDKLQEDWEKNYKLDMAKANSKESGNYFAAKVKELTQFSNEAIYNAKLAQGVLTNMKEEKEDLKDLLTDNNLAQGTLSVAQTGNQITAMQTLQMMRLQRVLASSQHAQSSYQAQAVVRDEMVRRATERYYSDERVTYSKGQGPGIIGINTN